MGRLSQKKIKFRFGEFYEQLNTKKGRIIFLQPLFFLFRRISLAFTVIYCDKFIEQTFMIVSQIIFSIIIIGIIRPWEDPNQWKKEIFNEIIMLVTFYHVMCFTPFLSDGKTQHYLGYSCIFFVGFHLLFNMCIILHISFCAIKYDVIVRLQKRKMRKFMAIRKPIFKDILDKRKNKNAILSEESEEIIDTDQRITKFKNLKKLMQNQTSQLKIIDEEEEFKEKSLSEGIISESKQENSDEQDYFELAVAASLEPQLLSQKPLKMPDFESLNDPVQIQQQSLINQKKVFENSNWPQNSVQSASEEKILHKSTFKMHKMDHQKEDSVNSFLDITAENEPTQFKNIEKTVPKSFETITSKILRRKEERIKERAQHEEQKFTAQGVEVFPNQGVTLAQKWRYNLESLVASNKISQRQENQRDNSPSAVEWRLNAKMTQEKIKEILQFNEDDLTDQQLHDQNYDNSENFAAQQESKEKAFDPVAFLQQLEIETCDFLKKQRFEVQNYYGPANPAANQERKDNSEAPNLVINDQPIQLSQRQKEQSQSWQPESVLSEEVILKRFQLNRFPNQADDLVTDLL